MKLALALLVFLSMVGTAAAGTNPVSIGKLRLADAASDACFANCANQNASCKRVCPTTFSTPCVNACDSQMQTCTQSCQGR